MNGNTRWPRQARAASKLCKAGSQHASKPNGLSMCASWHGTRADLPLFAHTVSRLWTFESLRTIAVVFGFKSFFVAWVKFFCFQIRTILGQKNKNTVEPVLATT